MWWLSVSVALVASEPSVDAAAWCAPSGGQLTVGLRQGTLTFSDTGIALAPPEVPPDQVIGRPDEAARAERHLARQAPPRVASEAARNIATGVAELPFKFLLGGVKAVWIAMPGEAAGLYRVLPQSNGVVRSTLLASGEVLAMCAGADAAAWAALRGDQGVYVFRGDTDSTPVRIYALSEAVALALAHDATVPADVAAAFVAWSVRSGQPGLSAVVSIAMTHPDVSVRAAAALGLAALEGPIGIRGVFVLGHDAEPLVRRAAFEGAELRCKQEVPTVCAGLMRMFVGDEVDDIGWSARDVLLKHDLASALRDAPKRYKLDLLATINVSLHHEASTLHRQALDLLAHDFDFEVRETADLVLQQLER